MSSFAIGSRRECQDTGRGWTRWTIGSGEWRISVNALAASYAGNQVTFYRGYSDSQYPELEHYGNADATYPVVLRQTLLEQCRLDERWEPLALIPVALPVARDLSQPHHDSMYPTAFRDVLKNVLCDPLSLAVACSEGRRRVVERDFGNRRSDLAICMPSAGEKATAPRSIREVVAY